MDIRIHQLFEYVPSHLVPGLHGSLGTWIGSEAQLWDRIPEWGVLQLRELEDAQLWI